MGWEDAKSRAVILAVFALNLYSLFDLIKMSRIARIL